MAFVSSLSALHLRRASLAAAATHLLKRSSASQHARCSANTPVSPPVSGPNFFLNTTLSRIPSTTFPNDVDELLQRVSDADRFIPIWKDKPLIASTSDDTNIRSLNSATVSPVLWTPARLKSWLEQIRQDAQPPPSPLTVSLVQSNTQSHHTTYFAVDVSHSKTAPTSENQSAQSLRTVLSVLETETEAALIAHARALVSWHHSATYCSRCGQRTSVTQGGAARACSNSSCKTRNIYPRVMPSVLVLVLRDGGREVLLGRKASWPAKRYSLLAGFAEIFESLEQTVVREVFEETGVRVDESTIEYHSSQPWPSQPHASLMSGFKAHVTSAKDAQITVDRDELDDAKWFRKDWLLENLEADAPDGAAISIPGRTSLARRLILEWLREV